MVSILFYIALFLQGVFAFEKSIDTKAKDFMVDELGNIYLIHSTFIERYNAVGTGRFRTSELSYGNIEYFDVTNPLKPFIYYRGLGKLVFFDNTLSQQGDAVDLFDRGYTQVELIAGSRGDAYWMWDARNSELLRVDQNFQPLTSTGNLSVLLAKEINPSQILERGNHVYLRDSLNGVFVFDIYGTYRTTLNIQTKQDIQVRNDEVIFSDGMSVHVISSDWIAEEVLALPEQSPGRIFFFNRQLFFLRNEQLRIYALSESGRN